MNTCENFETEKNDDNLGVAPYHMIPKPVSPALSTTSMPNAYFTQDDLQFQYTVQAYCWALVTLFK